MTDMADKGVKAAKLRTSRAVLTKSQVLQIFSFKVDALSTSSKCERSTSKIAKMYGVTEKAIRDIWTGRTWFRDTLPLEPTRPETFERLKRRPGRPKGSKDRKQRIKGMKNEDNQVKLCPAVIRYIHTIDSIESYLILLFDVDIYPGLSVLLTSSAGLQCQSDSVSSGLESPTHCSQISTIYLDSAGTTPSLCTLPTTNKLPSMSTATHVSATLLYPSPVNATDPCTASKRGQSARAELDWLRTIEAPSATAFLDPFHDDWPYWREVRAGQIAGDPQ